MPTGVSQAAAPDKWATWLHGQFRPPDGRSAGLVLGYERLQDRVQHSEFREPSGGVRSEMLRRMHSALRSSRL
jgi:hypothetical protein